MPVKKFDKKSLDVFKKQLVKMKEDVSHDIKNMASETSAEKGSSGDSGHALHMADVATDMYDREFNLGLASNDRELLSKIDFALKRIEQSTFGTCIECKKSIALARLKAIPYTETCLQCQEKIEGQQ